MLLAYILLIIFLIYFTTICLATKAKTLNNFAYAGIISGVTGLFFSVIYMIVGTSLALHSLAQRAAGGVPIIDTLSNKTHTSIPLLLALWVLAALVMTAITLWIPVISYPRIYKKRIIWGILIANIIIVSTIFLL